MARSRRRVLARFAAPAAFLLAVTIAVLLVRAALRDGGGEDGAAPVAAETRRGRAATSPGSGRRRTATSVYVIKRGDTLETVAERNGTTVQQLRALNPGVNPVRLSIGQRIRVP